MGYKDICPHDECTGCMACINGCNHNAIQLHSDPLGFIYPQINLDKCFGCGLCVRICPQNNPREFLTPVKCYASAIKNKGDLSTCASGGVATALSIQVIKSGGIVVGCSGEDINDVKHIIVEDLADIEKLKGSKYIQSKISDTLFKQIRFYLNKGRLVLFIGTGCQTAGLLSFLVKPYKHLITVDLVCHGVSSQKMLSEDLALYGEIVPNSVKFRKKIDRKPYIKYIFSVNQIGKRSTIKKIWYKEPYLGAFMAGVSFREGCYSCQYAKSMRQSDLTICDFWGLNKDSRLSCSKGVSAILVSTEKGQKLIDDASYLLEIEERSIEEAIRGNGQLQSPSLKPPYRNTFQEIYIKKGIKYAYNMTTYRLMVIKYLRQQVPTFILKLYARCIKFLLLV